MPVVDRDTLFCKATCLVDFREIKIKFVMLLIWTHVHTTSLVVDRIGCFAKKDVLVNFRKIKTNQVCNAFDLESLTTTPVVDWNAVLKEKWVVDFSRKDVCNSFDLNQGPIYSRIICSQLGYFTFFPTWFEYFVLDYMYMVHTTVVFPFEILVFLRMHWKNIVLP